MKSYLRMVEIMWGFDEVEREFCLDLIFDKYRLGYF